MESLAVKFRPREFSDVVSQSSIIKILTQQIDTNNIKNVYLFYGASGCGKTTVARIFANKVNKGLGVPIELDAASNNGVENIRQLIKSASERSLDSEYKVIIIDECHALTNQAWQAFLKCIEEPPKYTIFIFCTTEKNKVPETIKNRCQVFNFTRITSSLIKDRLMYICKSMGLSNYEEACEHISKISDCSLRTAISNLEKCIDFDNSLSITSVLDCLGSFSIEMFFSLMNAIIDGDELSVSQIISYVYEQGNDMRLFVDDFFSFAIDLSKYILFKSCSVISIPSIYEQDIVKCVNFEGNSKYYSYIIDNLLKLKEALRFDSNYRFLVECFFIKMARCE